jgi:uncharacterized protein YceK
LCYDRESHLLVRLSKSGDECVFEVADANMRCLALSLVLGASTALSGCGTAGSRFHGAVVGGLPFQAVAFDVLAASATGAPDAGVRWLQGLVSLPFDLVIDAVLMPADVVAWIFGVHKARRTAPHP